MVRSRDQIWTIQKVAEEIGVKRSTLYYHVLNGRIKPSRVGGRYDFDLDNVVAACRLFNCSIPEIFLRERK
ncbi:helix-turn-helix transcriptional regulator [Singulisphaera rosea]